MKPTLVIGDVHGNFDRLTCLLEHENIIDPETQRRTNRDVEVIQIGDLGHFGKGGSPTGDRFCWENAEDFFDKITWGNHDLAVFSNAHGFQGYQRPNDKVADLMSMLRATGRLRMAHEAHGYLLTHAGLGSYFTKTSPEALDSTDPKAVAHYINKLYGRDHRNPLWDMVGRRRGGPGPWGGILWRDAKESLYDGLPQVFGHSAGDKIREYPAGKQKSYCIDVGTKKNGRLAAIWLPQARKVEIKI
jgi:hypothetical protein